MSILIKGMKMPSKGEYRLVLYCHSDGTATLEGVSTEFEGEPFEVVEVPTPHGRLVDADWIREALIHTLEALKKNPKMDRQEMHLIAAFSTLGRMLEDAPTIIEAEEGEKE